MESFLIFIFHSINVHFILLVFNYFSRYLFFIMLMPTQYSGEIVQEHIMMELEEEKKDYAKTFNLSAQSMKIQPQNPTIRYPCN